MTHTAATPTTRFAPALIHFQASEDEFDLVPASYIDALPVVMRSLPAPAYKSSGVLLADTLVWTGRCVVHTVTFTAQDAAATAGSVAIRDATVVAAGTKHLDHTFPAAAMVPVTLTLDAIFENGIFVDFTTTADVHVTVTFLPLPQTFL